MIPRDPRTQRLLQAPVLPLLIAMSLPNMLIMLAQASSGLIETFWISKLGTEALAGMALVFPVVMLMTMISAGSLGGAISSSVARALGRGEEAHGLVWHALVINIAIGLATSAVFLAFGRPIYRALGGEGAALEAALLYSNTVFAGNVFTWTMNGLASVIRGSGNMAVPAWVSTLGVLFLVPVSPVLIFGLGPIPAMGVAGGGLALVSFYACATAIFAGYIASGRNPARFRRAPLRRGVIGAILRMVGPFYGFFGLGLILYFVAQGQQRLRLPLMAGAVRVAIALGGGWLALRATGDIRGLYAALALGLLAYGLIMLSSLRPGSGR